MSEEKKLFLNTDVPVDERKVIICGKEDTITDLKKVDWTNIALDWFVPYKLSFEFIKSVFSGKNPIRRYSKDAKFSIMNIKEAKTKFKFPVGHPKLKTAYACSETKEDEYVLLSSFNSYEFQLKLIAFEEMCVSLGAKTFELIYASENGHEIVGNVKGKKIPTEAGELTGGLEFSKDKSRNNRVESTKEFPKPKNIKEY